MTLQLRIAVAKELKLCIAKPNSVEHDTMNEAQDTLSTLGRIVTFLVSVVDKVQADEAVKISLELANDSIRFLLLTVSVANQGRRDTDSVLSEEVLRSCSVLILQIILFGLLHSAKELYEILIWSPLRIQLVLHFINHECTIACH